MIRRKTSEHVELAHSVAWAGLCPCGCGAFKAVLIDDNGDQFASFGWEAEGWLAFMRHVTRQLLEATEGGEGDA